MKLRTRWMMMVVLTLCTAGATALQAQQDLPSGVELIKKHLAATGTAEARNNIKAIQMKGKMTIPQAGITGDIEMAQAEGGKALMKFNIPGIGEQSGGSDGKVVWELSQVTGPEVLSGVREQQMKRQLQLNAMEHYEEFFESIECTGTEEVDGVKCYVVVCKAKDEQPMTIYFNAETGLEHGSKVTAETAMGAMEIMTVSSDYKSVGDVKMAHKTVATLPNGMTQEITFESVEVNPKLPAKFFDLPAEIKSLVK